MRHVVLFLVLTTAFLGLGGNLLAYEGGTKLVATMASPAIGEAKSGPTFGLSYGVNSTKPVVSFFKRMPEPSLSLERIREEKLGRNLGTKEIVLFQKKA